jgi:flavin-dependent dehydrogenase
MVDVKPQIKNNSPFREVDALVIGGGPGGTTIAALLAEAGWRVLLLEKDEHPRFHIGESLLPGNLPILERLGVLEEVRALAVHKPGADFTGPDGNVQSFPFAKALGKTPPHAFQVTRSEFDQLLFDNCITKGVDARQRHCVKAVERVGQTNFVTYVDDHEQEHCVQAKLVVDASGRDGLVARKNGWRSHNRRHASAAVFGHFSDVQPRKNDMAGNISVYWFDQGWIWMIPLRDGVMSIGAVCWPSKLRERRTDLETFLREILAGVPDAAERAQHARAVSPINATGNYSYRSKRLYDDGLLLVGDAYAFIDPVFSSGVYLAMNGALAAFIPAQAWLNGDTREFRRAARRYRRVVSSKINAFSWFIYRFTTPTMRDLFRNPRNDWQVEQAVISMLAGDGDGSADIRKRLRIFKAIYIGYRCRRIGPSVSAWWSRRKNRQIVFRDETIMS